MATIVIYDSGVGGLSIYREVAKQCPHFRYVFVSDNQAFPYGTKGETELTARVLAVVAAIDKEHQPDLLVVACNSASTVALPALRSRFAFPIVGVVPAIKPAAALSVTKCIGLLATPGTIARPYTQALIDQHASNCQVTRVGSSELVTMAEQKLRNQALDPAEFKRILRPFTDQPELDVVVLACTHFPLLRENFCEVLGETVQLLDSGAAIAKRVASLMVDVSPVDASAVAVFSQVVEDPRLTSHLQMVGFTDVQHLPITADSN